MQYAVIFDRIFRFAITGTRVRNYDAVGGQLLFAWLHQRRVLHWTDTSLAFDWQNVPAAVVELSDAIDALYWLSIDRPKMAHWLAAYELVRSTLTPHPASAWARGLPDDILAGLPKGYTDAVLDDEFPLSMFFEALEKKMRPDDRVDGRHPRHGLRDLGDVAAGPVSRRRRARPSRTRPTACGRRAS